jgi:hypothetical protein
MTDPSGAIVGHVCASFGVGFFLGVHGSACIATDFHSIGSSETIGGGYQTPAIWGGIGVGGGTAHDIRELRGPFGYGGESILSVGASGYAGKCGRHHIGGGEVGWYPGFPSVEAHSGFSKTWVQRWRGSARNRC